MRKEMTCTFNCDIDEDLRKELADNRLTKTASAASLCDVRGIAMLELGYLDIELNIHTVEEASEYLEEATPVCDYFICVKCGDTDDPWEWESFGYADDYIGDAGHAHVDWAAENWEELLFADMLKSLSMFADTIRADKNLAFLSVNDKIF
jgi:hypothetical protein